MKSTTSNLLIALTSFVLCILVVNGLVNLMLYCSQEQVENEVGKREANETTTITRAELEELLKSAHKDSTRTKEADVEVKNNLEETFLNAMVFDHSNTTPNRNFSLNSSNKLPQKTNPNEPTWMKAIFAIGVLFTLVIFLVFLKKHKQEQSDLSKTSLNKNDVHFVLENLEQGKIEAGIKLILHNAENLSSQLENHLFKLYNEHRLIQSKFDQGTITASKYQHSNQQIEKRLHKVLKDIKG